jgi:hypothetical protein
MAAMFRRAALFLLFAVSLSFAQSDDFTIVALPDTQVYSKDYPQIFKAQTQWIANNVAAKNIKLVLMEGDIVNGGGETYQWQNADAAMKILNGKVPYMVAMGNHDYDQNQPDYRTASAELVQGHVHARVERELLRHLQLQWQGIHRGGARGLSARRGARLGEQRARDESRP